MCVFGGRLAQGYQRAAHEQAVQRIACTVAFGNESAEYPILLPMIFQTAQQLPFAVVELQQMKPHAFHHGKYHIGRVFFGNRIGRRLHEELSQSGSFGGFARNLANQQDACFSRSRAEGFTVAEFFARPIQSRRCIGDQPVQLYRSGNIGIVLPQGKFAERAANPTASKIAATAYTSER